jgi:hypothetical protein
LAFAAQGIEHPPQWLALVLMSTHCEPHKVEVGAVQPVTHWYMPLAPEQSGAVASHRVVHEPHVSIFDKSASQPSFASVLQFAKPVLQAPMSHTPAALHVAVA